MEHWTTQLHEELTPGVSARYERKLSVADIGLLAMLAGDQTDAMPTAAWTAGADTVRALIAATIGLRLPGPGADIAEEHLHFEGRIAVDDLIVTELRVEAQLPDRRHVLLAARCTNQHGQLLAHGTLRVACPVERQQVERAGSFSVALHRYRTFEALFERCRLIDPVRTAIVHPCDAESLRGPLEAAARGIIVPVLVGPRAKIGAAARAADLSLAGLEIVDVEHSHAAAAKAVELARAGRVEALMKGSLHTDELMAAVVPSATGLRTARRISHVFVMDVPTYPKPLLITDAAINIQPDLETKRDIVQNAIDLAQVLGIARPKVAILSAVETINPRMPATLDAAVLCKMADRGQITGGVLDGPLAFDNAISAAAARIKKIDSPVAGDPDILLAPDLEAGNMIAKQLSYLAAAQSAGIVLGTRVPIVLTSRADDAHTREASTAVMALVAHSRRAAPRG
jgi:phosphate acetyltransferase